MLAIKVANRQISVWTSRILRLDVAGPNTLRRSEPPKANALPEIGSMNDGACEQTKDRHDQRFGHGPLRQVRHQR